MVHHSQEERKNNPGKVTKTNRLEYLLPNVQAYNPLVDN